LAILFVTGAHGLVMSYNNGNYQRADWRSAATYVEQSVEPGDVILVERMNTQQAFTNYFEEDAPGAPPLLVLSEMPEGRVALNPPSGRVWVVYRNPNEDVHRQGAMPEFDPFEMGRTTMGDWLNGMQEQVIEQRRFNGVRVLLVDLGQGVAPVSNP
jgi:hypothetical protein